MQSKGIALTNDIRRSVMSHSTVACAATCVQDEGCHRLAFEPETGTCTLSSADASAELGPPSVYMGTMIYSGERHKTQYGTIANVYMLDGHRATVCLLYNIV